MWSDKAQVVKEDIKTEELKEAHKLGSVEKYTIDVGWEQSIKVYVIYGCSGGDEGSHQHHGSDHRGDRR